jgi:xanthine dehydrogenase small subunit
VVRERDGRVVYEPVKSCITQIGQLDGAELITVEDLADYGVLHPVQAAMARDHGSQCGFCTPGIVMSLFAHYHECGGTTDRQTLNDVLAGNLCRCTGYRPIVDAAVAACAAPRRDRFQSGANDMTGVLSFLSDGEDVFVGNDERFFAAPGSIDSLAALYEKHPDATIVAGATDVGLWITKQLRDLPKVIHIGKVAGLDKVEDTGHELIIGAGATYAQAEPFLKRIDPDIGELVRRIGSKQVRASGTVGGNVANGSPIGDMPPILIALEAQVELRKGRQIRSMPVQDFYIEYGKQKRDRGELVTRIVIPRPRSEHIFRCYKVSKRFDQDISAVMGAFRLTVNADGLITEARLAYGGMAGVPKRASHAEQALTSQQLRDSKAWARAFAALREDFMPLDDHRASARYRIETAHSLLGKALIEAAGTATTRTRVVGQREKV